MRTSSTNDELMVGFLINKLARHENKKLQNELHKVLKKGLKNKKSKLSVGEFNTFLLANSQYTNTNFLEPKMRSLEEPIHSLYRDYLKKTTKLLRTRMKWNRSELESNRILAKFLESTPKCPPNPNNLISQENQKMETFLEQTINYIVERSWILFWAFNNKGEDRIIIHDGTFHREYEFGKSFSALNAFDELLILNFAYYFLKSLEKLLNDITERVSNVRDSFSGSKTISVSDPDLASEAFGILVGDLVGGIDALQTIIRQITRIE
ncbi:MAG: hypothetical protein ACFFC6_12815, partial [Promethearchaeota archaeon]